MKRRSLLPLLSLLPLTALVGCATTSSGPGASGIAEGDPPQPSPMTDEQALEATLQAMALVGTPYRWGGNTPESGFDCSGLVNYVFRDMAELRLPRTSRELASMQGPKIEPRRLAAADLVFFGNSGTVTHVGIYVGEGRFVHAPSSGGTVRLDHLDSTYWRSNYSGARRVLR